MTVLFPRLDALSVDHCLENLDQFIEAAGRPITLERMPSGTSFAASGGSQVEPASLAELRSLVVDAARQCGFPDRGTVEDRARFDFLASIAIAGFEQLAGGEADRDDVWAFIATILLPDVVAWRFIARSPERFHGGVRNTFQRLWMRMWALDGGDDAGTERWGLLEQLTEDALVQLTERPSLGANRALSRAIASAWVMTAETVGRSRMQDVMRSAIIDVRIRNEIQLLDLIMPAELDAQVRRFFDARAALA
jgi:hypothetical protein